MKERLRHSPGPAGRVGASACSAARSTRRAGGSTRVLTNEHVCLAFAQVEWDTVRPAHARPRLNPHEILRALEEHMQALPRGAGARPARSRRRRSCSSSWRSLHASRSGRHAVEATDLFSAIFEETQGVPVSIIRRLGVEPETVVSRLATRMRDQRAARGAAQEALRAAAVPEALRHQPEPARAAGPHPAAVRPRRRDEAGARDPLPSRARQFGAAARRARASARPRSPKGWRGCIEFEPETVPVRLRDCQIVNLQMNTMVAGHHAPRDVRGSHPERHPRDQGAAEPDSLHRRGPHDDRRRVGARRAVGRGEHLQVGARPRRSPHHRGDHAQRVQGVHPGRRGAGAALPDRPRRRADDRGNPAHPLQPAAAARAQLLASASRTRRSRPRSRCRRGTCGTCSCPTRSSAGSTPPPSRPRSSAAAEVTRRATWSTSSRRSARIPEDMVFRDVTDRFRDVEDAISARGVVGQEKAIQAVARRLVLNKGPLKDGFDRPDGVLLFLGPTGVGKTELAKSVAAVPVRRREEDDPRRHVRVPGWRGRGRQADRHAARHRRLRARRRADQPAEGQSRTASCCWTKSRRPARAC